MSLDVPLTVDRLTPFLKWAGGKRWFVARYGRVFPQSFNRYFEPFLGSAAVYFYLRPDEAILSDLNPELINTYNALRNTWRKVYSALAEHSNAHSEAYYYSVRASLPSSSVDRAARFLYLNRTCWNGLYRVNKRGEFNVPIGTKDSVLLDSDDFAGISSQLKDAKIKKVDFEETINCAGFEDLIFVDPPYTVRHNLNGFLKYGFLKYNDKIFSWDDQLRLRDALVRADGRGAYIVMTNANHESIREIYSDFHLASMPRHSVLSGVLHGRGATEELLITNFRLAG